MTGRITVGSIRFQFNLGGAMGGGRRMADGGNAAHLVALDTERCEARHELHQLRSRTVLPLSHL